VAVVGKLFGLADGLAVGDLVGVPVESGLALGLDVVGKLFGLAVGLALGDWVVIAVSPQSLNDMFFKWIECDGAPSIGPLPNVNWNDVSGPGIVIKMFPPVELFLKFSFKLLRKGPLNTEVS
jgi:hypothetical protein